MEPITLQACCTLIHKSCHSVDMMNLMTLNWHLDGHSNDISIRLIPDGPLDQHLVNTQLTVNQQLAKCRPTRM